MDMIGMFMRDEDAAQAFRRASDGEQSLADLPSAQAGVDEQARLGGFQIGAIAAGTAAEKGELGGHERTLKRGDGAGNVFDDRWKENCVRIQAQAGLGNVRLKTKEIG